MIALIRYSVALSLFCSFLLSSPLSAGLYDETIPLNMDFESDDDSSESCYWEIEGPGYSGYYDSLTARSGNTSYRIQFDGPGSAYGGIFRVIPFPFEGDSISFSAWFYTGDADTCCTVGVYLDMKDRYGKYFSYDYVSSESPTDSSGWFNLVVTIENNPFGHTTEFGAFLMGEGTVWVDDMELLLDGRPLTEADVRQTHSAEQDHEFDDGSDISITEVNDFQLESLVLLGRVWSFLKYHHPSAGRGNVNWDYSLFRSLPAVLDSDTEYERGIALAELVENLDPVIATNCSLPSAEEIFISSDIDWIFDPGIGSELSSVLEDVYDGRYQEQHYYVRGSPYQVFNEESYDSFECPDAGYRLLALYRFWGIIEYYYPYKYGIEDDWNDVLEEFIPVFLAADTPLAYQLAVQSLIVRIDDAHARITDYPDELEEFFGALKAPMYLCRINDSWVVDGIAHESVSNAGIRIGDVITEIDGQSIQDRAAELLPYISSSSEETVYFRLGYYLLRGNTDSVRVSCSRGNDSFVSVIPRFPADSVDWSLAEHPAVGEGSYSLFDDDIGYVFIGTLLNSEIPEMMEAMAGTQGLVLDLREYPADFVIFTLAEYIIPEETVFARFVLPDFMNPGTFVWIDPNTAGGGEQQYQGKVAVLVDVGTVSAGEFTAMAWRLAPEARVFGTPTNGTDGNVVTVPFPGGLEVWITGLGVYNPDRSETQRVGILPDVYVSPTVDGMQAGNDELLDTAIEWIRSGR